MPKDARLGKHIACLLGCALLIGCGAPGEKAIQVHWQLIDGRPCTDAGAVATFIRLPDGTEHSGRCSLLPDGNRIDLPSVQGGSTISARAVSASQAVLYRATLTLPPQLPEVVELTLTYSGGR
ncbi:MAG TPA: hypothetical protein PKW11_13505 [Pseudomonadota bacterium]|nr:hypothetical protein [Pseudomonadota bacterium]